MKIRLFFPGKIKERYYVEALQEYQKRLQKFCEVEIVFYKEAKIKSTPSPSEIRIGLEEEEKTLFSFFKEHEKYLILDPEGQTLNSYQFADFIEQTFLTCGSKLNVLIGSSYGFSDNVKKKAFASLSLSSLTFTHQMIPMIFLEQIYRGFAIKNRLTYHK